MFCFGDVAQLGEHQVRNLGVEGSIPFVSTNNTHKLYTRRCMQRYRFKVDESRLIFVILNNVVHIYGKGNTTLRLH